MLTGGCYCGAIKYAASNDTINQANCHCEMCRGTTGAPCVAWFTVPASRFHFLSGHPTHFRSSQHATRTFCPTCGTQLTFIDDAYADEIDITTCSLDNPNLVPPQSHIYIRSQVNWLKLADSLPRYQGSRSEG